MRRGPIIHRLTAIAPAWALVWSLTLAAQEPARSLAVGDTQRGTTRELREPVHPRLTVETFEPVDVRFVRFTILATNGGEPCLDELEVYGPADESRNLALAANGARALAPGSLPGYAIHELKGVNDGAYGNGRSWIADRQGGAWVQIELPAPAQIHRIVWSRDREGKFIDRLPTHYVIEGALEPGEWRTLASSEDREPGPDQGLVSWIAPATRQFVHRFVPVSTSLPAERDAPLAEYTIDTWQSSDGLPGNTVTAISQDPVGYLWLGTLNGLVRFDGLRFEVFGEDAGLPSSRILCLLHDSKGTLWIGTEGGGLSRWRAGQAKPGPAAAELARESIFSLTEGSDGGIWFGASSGLHVLRGDTLAVSISTPADGPQVPRVVAHLSELWCAINGNIWIRDGDRLIHPAIPGEPSQFSSLFALHHGPSGRLWFGGANHYIAALDQGKVTVFPQQAGHLLSSVWELLETRSGDVWIGTANGGLRRLRDGRFLSLTTQDGLSDNSIRSLCEDAEGNLWVGTVGGGLNRVKPRRVSVFTTRHGLSHDVVMSLAEDAEGTRWVGSNCGGLSVAHGERFETFRANYLLENECIWSLLPARDGTLWIGTWGGGLFRHHHGQVSQFPVSRRADDEPLIALCEAENGALWAGTYSQGLLRFENGRFRRCILDDEQRSAAPVTSLIRDPQGGLWVGTGGAGIYYVPDAAIRRTLTSGEEPLHLPGRRWTRDHSLPSNAIRTMYLDAQGTLWTGTESGLARIRAERVEAFTRTHGLADEVISQILEDDSGRLWLGSNRGIFSVPRAEFDHVARVGGTLGFTIFRREDGMENVECTGGFHPAGLRTRDGRLWFSTVKGLVCIDPSRLELNHRPPPVVLEQLLLDGQPQPIPSPSSPSSEDSGTMKLGAAALPSVAPRQQEPLLRIPRRIERVEFRFTALSLVSPERNRFHHRLEGLETDWIDAGAQRSAAYTRLPPGRYRFVVKACNNDGVWNDEGASFAFQVLPPFWSTWWFVALGGGISLAGAGWAVRWWSLRKLHRRLERLERQHAIEKERTRIARDIHDDLGATLTRISLLTELAQKRRDRPVEVTDHLRQISSASREMVQAMDTIVWAVNPRNDSLEHLANYLSQFAEGFFRQSPVRCRLDVPADLPDRSISTEARHHLFLAAKEALNNVARHSGANEVWLRMGIEGRDFVLRIEDNGCGLSPQAPASDGDGLRNIRQRLEEIGGRLEARKGDAGGLSLKMSWRLPAPE